MHKRNHSAMDDLLALFIAVPWWIGPIVSVLGFLVFRYALSPMMLYAVSFTGNDKTRTIFENMKPLMQQIPPMLAPWVAGLVLFVWLASLVQKQKRRALLASAKSIEKIRSLSWREFELLVGEFYRRKGYMVEERGGPEPDGGVDVVLRKEGETVLVQCKHWKDSKVGVRPVRELRGVITHLGATRGILIASGQYTDEARRFAESNGIDLVNGDALAAMIAAVQGEKPIQNPIPVETPQRREEPASAPVCPRCGAPMVLRTARTGKNAGSQFYGCTQYPGCRGVRPVG